MSYFVNVIIFYEVDFKCKINRAISLIFETFGKNNNLRKTHNLRMISSSNFKPKT